MEEHKTPGAYGNDLIVDDWWPTSGPQGVCITIDDPKGHCALGVHLTKAQVDALMYELQRRIRNT